MLLILFLQYSEFSILNFVIYFILSKQSDSRTQLKFRNILDNLITKTTISKTKKTSLYNSNFKQNLIDNYIYSSYYNFFDNWISSKLSNWKNINKKLKKSRLSLFLSRFSDKIFDIFIQINSRILNKNAVINNIFSVIQSTVCILSVKNLIFDNLESLIYSNLIDTKSDFYNKARSVQIDLQIREKLELYIISVIQKQISALFNIFIETKSFDKNTTVFKQQTCFDSILNTCNIYKLRLFKTDNTLVYNNNIYIITSIYYDSQLKIYTIYFTQSIDYKKSSESYITQFNSWILTDFYKQFRQEISVFRNIRNWTKLKQDKLIAVVNSRITNNLKKIFILQFSIYYIS